MPKGDTSFNDFFHQIGDFNKEDLIDAISTLERRGDFDAQWTRSRDGVVVTCRSKSKTLRITNQDAMDAFNAHMWNKFGATRKAVIKKSDSGLMTFD